MTGTTAPDLSLAQRQAALVQATEVRQIRARFANHLSEGTMTVPKLFELIDNDATSAAAGMKVTTVLRALPGVGEKRTAALMSEAGIKENRRLRGVGARQREALLGLLDRVQAR